MFRFRLTQATLVVLVLVSLNLASGRARAEDKTLRVYHVGNSVTDTIKYRALAELARSRGHHHVWGRHMIPGAPLAWIWKHPDQGFQERPFGYYPRALAEYEWDVLTLQPFDRHLEKGDESDLAMARNFIDLARKKSPQLQVYVYQRWPRRDEPKKREYQLDYAKKWLREYTGGWDGTNETRDYFERLTKALRLAYPDLRKPVLLVPVGDVLFELDKRIKDRKVPGYTDIGQLYADGIHFNDVGAYVVGCTFFATLYKESPVGLSSGPYQVKDEKLARAIQETVWDVVSNHPLAGIAKGSPASGEVTPP